MKSGRPCFVVSNSNAPPMALAVQLPICSWSYTGGHPLRRSALDGRAASAICGAEKRWSRASGRSGIQP